MQDDTLWVGTYNVHACEGTDRRYSRSRIVEVVTKRPFDLLALQEIGHRRSPTDMRDTIAAVAERTGLHPIVCVTMARDIGPYGHALLVRHPVVERHVIDLSVPRREPRFAIDARIALPEGILRVISTHLGVAARERTVQWHLLDEILCRSSRPYLLIGDLNEWRPWYRFPAEVSVLMEYAALRTFPSRRPFFPLDRILVSAPDALHDLHVLTDPPAHMASDHLPLVARLARHALFSGPEDA